MKSIINSFKIIILTAIFTVFYTSCNEDEYLKETPLDFFTPENSYTSYKNFQTGITGLYARMRSNSYEETNISSATGFAMWTGTDIIKNARGDNRRMGNYNVWMDPTNGDLILRTWVNWYKLISDANTIISRLEVAELTEEEKTEISAEAKFFRAMAYRYLVYLWGGVPLLLEELSAPKTDLTRASRNDILNQMISDLEDAANNLPPIQNVVDGKVSNIVAQHFLAETFIALGEYDKAITAASITINDPATSLMTERFGTRAGEPIGDVYYDLFRRGNQNRNSANNFEALWVCQFEVDVIGGIQESTSTDHFFHLERACNPVARATFKDPDGKEGTVRKPISDLNTGGRGVSFVMNTDFFLNDLWENDWENDIRNAPHNIIRDFVYNNPSSAYYDSSAVKYPSPTDIAQDWRWYPWLSKTTTPGNHPEELYADKDKLYLKNSAGSTYRDDYYLRLAETYLLRAEAYHLKGDNASAAADINVVRERSKATPITASDVSIDYILDERARELVYEEERQLTLRRTGKLLERVRKYNELNKNNIEDHHVLWPIPFSEIEANKDAVIEQNPGYN